MRQSEKPILVVGIGFFCLWGMTAVLLVRMDTLGSEIVLADSYLPSGKYLRVTSLGFKEAMADILWLRAVQLMGGSMERGYPWFYQVMDRITDLDPKFKDAYKAGAITLSVLSDYPDLSIQLLEKGMQYNPSDWQIPFYIGFNYLYHKNDSLKAASYMERASQLEGHPPYLPLLTARLYNQGGNRETAILFLKGISLTTQDETMREKIAQRIVEIEKGEDLEPVAPIK